MSDSEHYPQNWLRYSIKNVLAFLDLWFKMERKLSQTSAKIFVRISQSFSGNFAFFRKNELSKKYENNAKFHEIKLSRKP